MGARRMTLADFYVDNGFGQVDSQGRRSYPEYPPLNTKLQQLYKYVPTDSPVLGPILGQLDLARVHQEQGYMVETAKALETADELLDQALDRFTGNKRWWAVLAVVVAVVGITVVMASRRRKRVPARRQNSASIPRHRRRRRNLPPPPEDDEDDDDAGGGEDDDDAGGGEDDDEE